ncbi:hypothetical protein EGT71_14765 [Atlantibacter subterranea]|uniref:Ead/Ea22-like family protein n=1 Tax=Atlantibacter subterraneus TaxID=255519 RepID=A0A427UVG4_9ENTR|nr:hypothetical protein [Atlantibacter subterranea]RSB61506.1 hypothetical protein EGK67_13195 [Atlantibacter subterranea]RSE04622.1 hypothetical protein EGT84_12895 [Atlantibacter subterranea]RSE24440.1 hypothetical protein EGT71_14765 [Atlantibacter subterranea]
MTLTAEQLAQLRAVAERANTPGSLTSYSKATALMEFDALITPDITLALLDELEAAQELIELQRFKIERQAEDLHQAKSLESIHRDKRFEVEREFISYKDNAERNTNRLAKEVCRLEDELAAAEKRIAELEARTVTVKLPAHKYRECVNGLLEEAIAYAGTQQLRERISSRLANFVQPDHPHTRCDASINLTVEG